jgi:RHS repeat-associated protein
LYYSSNWQVLEEDGYTVGGSPQVNAQYVWGMAYVDEMVLRDRDSGNDYDGNAYGTSSSGLDERYYALQDANWNTIAIVSPEGLTTESFVYDPYGNAMVMNAGVSGTISDAVGWVYRHQGGRWDSTTGLYNFRHRDYSVTMGRWGEEDRSKVPYVDGLNLYLNDVANPIDYNDPYGTSAGVYWGWKLAQWGGDGLIEAIGLGPEDPVADGLAGGWSVLTQYYANQALGYQDPSCKKISQSGGLCQYECTCPAGYRHDLASGGSTFRVSALCCKGAHPAPCYKR